MGTIEMGGSQPAHTRRVILRVVAAHLRNKTSETAVFSGSQFGMGDFFANAPAYLVARVSNLNSCSCELDDRLGPRNHCRTVDGKKPIYSIDSFARHRRTSTGATGCIDPAGYRLVWHWRFREDLSQQFSLLYGAGR